MTTHVCRVVALFDILKSVLVLLESLTLFLKRLTIFLQISIYFRNFAIIDGELTPSRQKKNKFFCFALDFS